MRTYTVTAVAHEHELSDLLDMLTGVFNFPRELADESVKHCGRENFRVIRGPRGVVGGLLIYRMGQFFGGRSVPMAGIALVGVAPEARGTGAARALMCQTMEELRGEGFALSTLYPATQTLYRRAGFEQAGGRYEVTAPLGSIDIRKSDTEVRPLTDADNDAVADLCRRCAARTAGNLDRNAWLWHRVRHRMGNESKGLGVYGPSGLEGYVYFIRTDNIGGPFDVLVRDMASATPAAGRQLLTLLGHERAIGRNAIWYGSPHDPILGLLDEQPYTLKLDCIWMVRVVDVATALAARGYPAGIEAELHFQVRDDVLPANEGRFVLEVAGGSGTVRNGGAGALAIDVRGLASLYTGHRLPLDLIAMGQLDATPEAAKRAEAVFAGPAPWMSDMF